VRAVKIAMWSGPRNLSTAMMYAFAARGDCAVSDEPFYAAYLAATGLDHPMRAQVLASQPTDPAMVAAALAGPVPGGRAHWYQKHMAHHMLPGFPMDWAAGCTHVHLIRHPARVLASYAAKRENPTLEDIGFPQQQSLFSRFPGPVVDSADIRRDPAGTLGRLCAGIGLPFTPAMLRWAPVGVPEDGIWAAHWYGAVHRSTGFDGAEGPLPELPEALKPVLEAALPIYMSLLNAL
jgi:hypothetical protein